MTVRKIDVARLREVMNYMFDMLEKENMTEVELRTNWYWRTIVPLRYEVSDPEHPDPPSIGSLYDDWSDVEKMVLTEDEFNESNLEFIGSLLMYIGWSRLFDV